MCFSLFFSHFLIFIYVAYFALCITTTLLMLRCDEINFFLPRKIHFPIHKIHRDLERMWSGWQTRTLNSTVKRWQNVDWFLWPENQNDSVWSGSLDSLCYSVWILAKKRSKFYGTFDAKHKLNQRQLRDGWTLLMAKRRKKRNEIRID